VLVHDARIALRLALGFKLTRKPVQRPNHAWSASDPALGEAAKQHRRSVERVVGQTIDQLVLLGLRHAVIVVAVRHRSQAVGQGSTRYASPVAASQDDDEKNNVLEQALIVIDERNFWRSFRDLRVRALHESGAKLHAELEAEGAEYG
jgi:hypothetical protein